MAGNSMDMQINFDFQAKNLDQIVSQINQIQQAFQQKGKSVGFNDKDIKAYSNSLEILKQNTVKTFDVMNSKASSNKVGQALKQAGVDANNLQNAMRKLGVNGVSSLDNVSKSATQAKRELGKIGKGLKEISDTFTSALKWNMAYGSINAMSSSLKDAVHFAKELDSTLTDIRIVAGLTKDEAIAFGEEATKLAQRLGSTTSEYTKASLIYFQQGLDTSQVKEMTDATVMAANITGESARDMSDYLTAVVNGYGMVADEAMSVVDKLAAVGAATASDFGELSIGMSKVASMAKTAGVPIEKLAAQLSTIISTTREAPESVGTSLKTIYSRMLQFKTGTGKDSEGEDFSVPAVEKALEKFNQAAGTSISIFGKDGKLREDMSTVLDELGEKWDQVTNQQAKFGVATAIAGTRQMNSLMALLNGWDEYKSAVEVAQNSEGVGWEQNELFMESYEGKVKQLKSAQQGLYQNLFNADDMKPFIEGLTVIVKGATQLTKLFGGLPGILIALGPMLLSKLSVPLSQAVQNVKILRSTETSKVDKNEAKIDSLQNKGMITDEQAKKMKATNDEIRKNEELIESINKVKQARQNESEALDKATQKQQKKINSKEYYKAGANGENTQKRSIMNRFFETSTQGDEGTYTKQAKTIVEEESVKAQEKINNLKSTGQQKAQEVKKIEEETNEIIKKRLIDLAKESKFNEEHVQQAREERQTTEDATGISPEVSNEKLDDMSNNAGIKKTALQSDIDDTTKSLEEQYAAQMNVNTAISAGMNILFNMNQSYSSLGEAFMSGFIPALSLLAYTIIPAIINGATTLKTIINSTGGKVGLILTAISALTGVIKWFVDSSKRAAEANKEFQDSFKQQNSTIAQNATTLSGLSEKYKTLAKGVDNSGNNLSLTNEQYEEYKSIISQISEIMPNLAVKYNAQGEAIGFVTGKLEDLNEEYKKAKQYQYDKLLHGEDGKDDKFHDTWKSNKQKDETGTLYRTKKGKVEWYQDLATDDEKLSYYLKQNVDELGDAFKEADVDIDEYKNTEDSSKKNELTNRVKQAAARIAQKTQQELETNISNMRNVVEAKFGSRFVTELSDDQFDQATQLINEIDFSDWSEEDAQDWINELGSKLQSGDADTQEALRQVIVNSKEYTLDNLKALVNEDTAKALGISENELREILGIDDKSKTEERVLKQIDDLDLKGNATAGLKNIVNELPAKDLEDFIDLVKVLIDREIDLNNLSLDQIKEEIKKVKEENEQAALSFEDVSKKMDEVQSAYGTVKDAIRTYNETGAMSIDNLQAVLSLKPEYLRLFTNEQGELELSTAKIKEYTEALKQQMIMSKMNDIIKSFLELSPKERLEYGKKTEEINKNTDAILRNIEAKSKEAAQKDVDSFKKGNKYVLPDGREVYNRDYAIQVISGQYSSSLTDDYDMIKGLVDSTSFDLTSDSNDSDNKKDREDLEKKRKDLAKKKKEAEKQEKELGKKIRAAYKAEKEEIKRQKDLEKAIQDVADAQKDLVDKQKEYNDLLKKHEVDRYKESIEELTAAMEKLDDVASAIDSVMGLLGKDDYQKKYNLITQKIAQNDRIQAEANQEYQSLASSPMPDSAEAMQARTDAMQKAKDKSFQAAIDNEKQKKDLRNLEKEAQDRIDASNKELLDNTNSYFDNYIDNIRSAIDSIKGILDDFKRWQQGEISQDDYWSLTALKLENAALSLSSPIEKKDMTELDVTDIDIDSLLSQRKSDIDAIYEYVKEARAKAREEAEQDRQEEIEDMKEQIADAEERIVEAQEKVQDCEEAIQEGYIATAEAWDAVAEQRESMAETQNEIADLTTEIGTLEANLSGTMSATKKVTEDANTATKAMNVTKQAAEEASKAVENAAKEISSDASVGVLADAIIGAVKKAAENAKQSADYNLIIPDVLWGKGAITSFNMPTNVNSTADGLIGAMYGVIMYCIEKAKGLTKSSGNYHLYVPNINWGRNAQPNNNNQNNNYDNLIGVMYSTVIACFRQVNLYLGQLKSKQSSDYSLVAPALGKDWDKLQTQMEDKITAAFKGLNEKIQGMTIKAPAVDETGWTSLGSTISTYINSGIKQVLLKGGENTKSDDHPFVNSNIRSSQMTSNVNGIKPGMSVFFTSASAENGEMGLGHVGIMSNDGKIYHLENGVKKSSFAELERSHHYFKGAGWQTGPLTKEQVDKIEELYKYQKTFDLDTGWCQSWVSQALQYAQGTKDRVHRESATDAYNDFATVFTKEFAGSDSSNNYAFVYDENYSALKNLFAKAYINGIDGVGNVGELLEGLAAITHLSEMFEAGRGAATISNTKGDHGGKSYGLPQFSVKSGSLKSFIDYLRLQYPDYYNTYFKGLELASKSFDSGWTNMAKNVPEFADIQRQFNYNRVFHIISDISDSTGVNFADGGVLQAIAYSYATQYGRTGFNSIFGKNMAGWDLKKIINYIYDQKAAGVNSHFKSSSSEIRSSIKNNRIPKERAEALRMAGYAEGTKDGTHPGGLAMVGDEAQGKYEYVQTPDGKITKMGEHGAEIVNLPRGTTVFSHSDSVALEKVYGRGLKGLPKYAKGTYRFIGGETGREFLFSTDRGIQSTFSVTNSQDDILTLKNRFERDGYIEDNELQRDINVPSKGSLGQVISLEDAGITQEEFNNMSYYDRINFTKNSDNSSAIDENTKAINNNTEAQNKNTDVQGTVVKNETYNNKYVEMFNNMMTETADPVKGYIIKLSDKFTKISNSDLSDEDKQKKLIDFLQGPDGILAGGLEALEKMNDVLFDNADYIKDEIDKDATLNPTQKNEAKESVNNKLIEFKNFNSEWRELTYDILFDNINSQNEAQIAFMEKMNVDSVKIRKAQSDNIAELEKQYAINYEKFTKEQRQKAKETLQEAKKKLYEDERSALKESFSLIEDELKDSGEFGKIAEYYYDDLELIKKAYQDGIISMEEYRQGLKDTNDALEQLNKEQKSRIKTQFDAAISAVNTEFSKLKETLDDQKTAIDNYYDLESKITELKAEKSKEYDAELRRNYDKQIEFLTAQKELYKNEGDPKVQAELMRTINESIKSFDLMIAKDILEKKRNQKVNRIFNQDTQTFDWVEDFDAVAEAEKNVLSAEKDLKLLKLTNEQERYNLRKEDLEDALNKPQRDAYYEAALQFFGSDFVRSLSSDSAFEKNVLNVATVGAEKTYEVPDELKLNDNEKLLFGTNIFNQLDKDYTEDTRKLLAGVFYSKNTDYAKEMLNATSKEDFLKSAKQRLAKSLDMGSNQGKFLQDLAIEAGFTDLLSDKQFAKLIRIEENEFSDKTDFAELIKTGTDKNSIITAAKRRFGKSINKGTNYSITIRDLIKQNPNFANTDIPELEDIMKQEEEMFPVNSKENPEKIAYYAPKLTLAGRDWLKDITSYALKNNLVGQSFADSMNYSTLSSLNNILDKVRSDDNIDSPISNEEIKNITVNVQGLILNDNEKEVLADTLMKAIERQSITDKQ